MHVYIDFVSISRVTSSCSISLNVGIVICIVSSASVCPVNKIAKKKKLLHNSSECIKTDTVEPRQCGHERAMDI